MNQPRTLCLLGLLGLLGCQRSEPPPPAVGSGSAPPVLNVQVVGCAPAAALPHTPGEATPPGGWFPYARGAETPGEIAGPLAQLASSALVDQLSDLDLCLTDKTGSVSILLELEPGGKIRPRVGGIGHHPTELCIAKLVAKLSVPKPERVVELECGLSAGAAGPLRVDVEGGYRVVEASAEAISLDGTPAVLDQPLAGDAAKAVLVVATPDLPAARLAKVLSWTRTAPAVLVAVRADGGPPVFLAMAPDARRSEDPARITTSLAGDELRICAGKHRGAASVLQAKAIDQALGAAVAACGERCPETVEIAVGGDHVAKQLVGATSAVRRAGHDPVLTLGAGCGS